jgi:phage gp46-like protein
MPQDKDRNKKQDSVKELAKKYVDEQLEILRQHGSAVRISKNGYKSMVNQVMRASAK